MLWTAIGGGLHRRGIWCTASSLTDLIWSSPTLLITLMAGGDDSLLLFLQDLWGDYMFLSTRDLCPTPEMQPWEPSFLTWEPPGLNRVPTWLQCDSLKNVLTLVYFHSFEGDKQNHSLLQSSSWFFLFSSVQFSSVAQSCPTLCDPMNRSTSGLPVHYQLLEFTQTHVHQVSDAIQPSHPLSY